MQLRAGVKLDENPQFGKFAFMWYEDFPIRDSNGNTTNIKSYDAELLIRNAYNGKKYLYDIVIIKENIANATDLLKREARRASYKAASQSDVSDNSMPNKGEKVNQKNSEDLDTEYLELAKNPEQNRDKLQKMVDEAARKAGYIVKKYHAGAKDITKFQSGNSEVKTFDVIK